jgi:hypothetical protein
MSEHAPQPQLNQLRTVELANGDVRYQDMSSGNKFVPETVHTDAKERATGILLDTIHELDQYGDVTRDEVAQMGNELGLDTDYSKWRSGTGLKMLDRTRLDADIEERRAKVTGPSAEEAERIQHDQRQAEYDALFEGKSDEEIENEIRRNSHQKLVDEHNAKNRAENERRGERYALVQESHLRNKSVTELASLLGEKPDFKQSKEDYVRRVESLQNEVREEMQANNTVDLVSRTVENSPETSKTIDALKAFNKNMLRAHAGVSAEASNLSQNQRTARLGDEYGKLATDEERADFIKSHSKELFNQLITMVNEVHDGKTPLSDLSEDEITQLYAPLSDYMLHEYRGENGEKLTKEQVDKFLNGVRSQIAQAHDAQIDGTFEEINPTSAVQELAKSFKQLKTKEERQAFLDEHHDAVHNLLSDLMHAIDEGEAPFDQLSNDESDEAFTLLREYLLLNHDADTKSVSNFWRKLHGIQTNQAPDTQQTGEKSATPNQQRATSDVVRRGKVRNWASEKRAHIADRRNERKQRKAAGAPTFLQQWKAGELTPRQNKRIGMAAAGLIGLLSAGAFAVTMKGEGSETYSKPAVTTVEAEPTTPELVEMPTTIVSAPETAQPDLMPKEDGPSDAPVEPESSSPEDSSTAPSTEANSETSSIDSIGVTEAQLEQYTAKLANQLAPNNTQALMNAAIARYNADMGTNFALTPYNGSTWIIDAGRSISPLEMKDLNGVMATLVASGEFEDALAEEA